jgi:exonuclease VII small subunit
MSYSYIKSVFPNFKDSNKVYDESLYNNINTLYTDTSLGLPEPENLERSRPNYKHPKVELEQVVVKPESKIEAMSNVFNEYANASFYKPESQNNLSYYNLPIKAIQKQNTKQHNVTIESKNIEQFEEENPKAQVSKNESDTVKCIDGDCDQYIKHVLECSKCKTIAIKQLGIDNDRFRNEEMMELASYIIFGLFILLLIDSLKSDKR